MNTHTTNLPAIETHTFPNSHIISCLNLNLAQIAASGQCFRMLPVPEKPGIWSLISGTHYLEISGTPDGFFFDCPDFLSGNNTSISAPITALSSPPSAQTMPTSRRRQTPVPASGFSVRISGK